MKRIVLTLAATLALGLGSAAPSLAADASASGSLVRPNGVKLADFTFKPYGERVELNDRAANRWGVLLEIWAGSKLHRWCYASDGLSQSCNFSIKDGRNLRFFITEFDKSRWDNCAPSQGCGKRPHYWGGPGRMDCSGDCAHGRGDFYGEA